MKIRTRTGIVIADRSPVFEGPEVIGVISIFKDISRYEETAKELQTYKDVAAQLHTVIHSSYDGLYITNGNADGLFFNSAYLRVSGLQAADVEGKNMRDLVRQGTINQSVTLEVLEKRRRVTIVQQFSNGRTAIVTGNPVFGESGEITLVVSNVRDITELSQLREQVNETRTLARRYRDELKKASLAGVDREKVVFRSEAMENCVGLVVRVSDVDSPVLLTGESGAGKGMLARLVHNLGARKGGPFIHVNCGAIPAGLMEAELFGYERGAFTGASEQGKPGLFELADGGTLFLDEIGEIPLLAPGVAPQGARGARAPQGRGGAGAQGGRAHRRRHEPRPGGDDAGAAVPRRPLLPAERVPRSTCRRCGSGRRTSRRSSSAPSRS